MRADPRAVEQESSRFIAQLLELNRFAGEPGAFLQQLLRSKCQISGAEAAAILRMEGEQVQVVALAPDGIQKRLDGTWLREAMALAPAAARADHISIRQREQIALGETSFQQDMHLVFLPVKVGTLSFGVEVYSLRSASGMELKSRIEALELLLPYFDYYEARYQLGAHKARTERLHQVCDTLIKLNLSEGFMEAAMRLANELAARWGCSRASLGLLRGRYVRLKVMSNTEKFSRKIALAYDLERVMEECFDQDRQVRFPQEGAADCIARAAERFSHGHGPLALLSLPLRRQGKVLAVLTLERGADRPFSEEEEEALRLLLDLYSARLLDLAEQDRWFGARLMKSAGRGLGWLIGARHTWIKLVLLLAAAACWWLSQWRGMYQVEATFAFEPVVEQVLVAPFPGELEELKAENGQLVSAGDVLGVMDVAETRLKISALEAEGYEAGKRLAIARSEGKTAEVQIAQAQLQRIAADMKLLTRHVQQARLSAPVGGTIVAPDLAKRRHASLQFGEELLRIVSADRLRAAVYVPEEQIADVVLQAEGSLAPAAYPDRKLRYRVTKIDQVARVMEQKNVFRVEVTFLPSSEPALKSWAKAGMEGAARIDVREELYVWIWTRKALNWVRMKLWI